MVDKQLFSLIKPKKKYIWINIINNIFGQLMNVGITFFLIFLIKSIIENNKLWIILCSVIVFVLCICRFTVFLVSNHLANLIGDFASKKVRIDIYKKFLKLKNNNFKPNEMSQLSTEGIEQLKLYYGVYIPNLFYSVIGPLILFTIMCFVDWKVSLIYLVCVPIIPCSIMLVYKWAKKIFNKYWDIYLNLGNQYLDNTQGLKELRIFNADEYISNQLKKESEKFRKITMKVLVMQLASVTIMDLVAFGGAAIGIVVSLLIMQNGFDIYLVLFLILIGAEFFIPMRTLGSAFHLSMNGASAGKKILKLLDSDELKQGSKSIDSINNIELKNINININNKTILKDVNIKFIKNNFYTIIGESGCGKSTLVKNIAKLTSNYNGEIIINNLNIVDIDKSYYDHVCYISNNTHLFNTSIRKNFQFINPKITDIEIIRLLNQVNLNNLANINSLDLIINDDNSNISGGEKQRLILAIYLSKKYDLYIFDEITSNIDNESENIILNNIKESTKDSIVIFITHRIKNIKLSHWTYLIKDKQIAEQGTPKNLLINDTYTYSMYKSQKELEDMYEN